MTVSIKNEVILSRCKKNCRDSNLKRIHVDNHDGTFFRCTYCNRVYVVIHRDEQYKEGDVFTLTFKCIDPTFRPEEADEKFHIFLRESEEVTIPSRL